MSRQRAAARAFGVRGRLAEAGEVMSFETSTLERLLVDVADETRAALKSFPVPPRLRGSSQWQ